MLPYRIVSANLKTSSRYYSLQPLGLSASESASSCLHSDARTPRDTSNLTTSFEFNDELAAGSLNSPSQNLAWTQTQEHTTPQNTVPGTENLSSSLVNFNDHQIVYSSVGHDGK